jgi:putative ATP-dependent endonuclease of OLD family
VRLRTLRVENFRGIRIADLNLSAPFVALVGPGDSTKTTILDAVGLVLTPRYNVTFTDADFHNADTTSPIVIEAVVVDLPDTLVDERAHGKNRSGIRPDNTLTHDPLDEEGVEECLIIRLTVNAELEPLWEVMRPGEQVGDRMTASERAQLGYFRVGESSGQNLRWGRGSALTTLTQSKSGATHALIEAQRQARDAIRALSGTPLHDAATLAQVESRALGAANFNDLRPGLDPAFGAGSAALMLHDGDIPLTQFGLGTRRLLSLSIQENALAGRSMVSIDELESGLDPHRLANLIRHLVQQTDTEKIQVIFTTHSPLVVEALTWRQLFVVRSVTGATTVTAVPKDLVDDDVNTVQGIVRAAPSALLARRVVVGEGATEVGFLRAVLTACDRLQLAKGRATSVTTGTTVTNGGGDSLAPSRARAFTELGYRTQLVLDADVDTNAGRVEAASTAGTNVVQWDTPHALEDAIFAAVPIEAVLTLVQYVIEDRGIDSVADALSSRLPVTLSHDTPESWAEVAGDDYRRVLAATAKKAGWFKREDHGMLLGQIVWSHRNDVLEGDLRRGLQQIIKFVYADVS